MNDINFNKTTEHVYGLDIFRSFAIIFVLIGHTFEHSKIPAQLSAWGHLGVLGVELFFVLSGFLIGSIIIKLIKDNRFNSLSDISIFWKRRWLRTLPLYFFALLAFLRFDYHGRHDLIDFPSYYFFMQSFSYKIPEFFELSWSLSIEEHFYFWFPVIFLIILKITQKSIASIILTAVVLIFIAYGFRLSHGVFTDWNEYNRTIRLTVLSRIDAIMFGVLFSVAKVYWPQFFKWIKFATPFSAVAFVCLCAWWFIDAPGLMKYKSVQINIFSLQAFLCASLLPWFDSIRAEKIKNNFYTLTSKLSYSLYLMHILVIIWVNKVLGGFGIFDAIYGNPLIVYPVYFSFFYFVAWLTYRFIEKPLMGFRDVTWSLTSFFKAAWVFLLLCCGLIFFC